MNIVLGYSMEDRIKEALILNPFHYGEGVEDRSAVLDINVTDGQGRHYNVEMQVKREDAYIKRAFFYTQEHN